jgi:hypothetical protein
MRRVLALTIIVGTVFVISCGGNNGGGSSSPSSPTPTTTTFTLNGRVTETGATVTTAIVNANVSIGDGPNIGRSTTSDASGNYTLPNLQRSAFAVTASAEGYKSKSQSVNLTSDTTLDFGLDRSGPRIQFGAGQYLVGSDISPGRYFSDPADGCYWERESGLGGNLSDIIANNLIEFDAPQWIVDVLPTDTAFKTEADCGTWFNAPRLVDQAAISPGMWLVNSQLPAGTYRANASLDCYWERLRNFEGTLSAILANNFVTSEGQQLVDIKASDAGFHSEPECGTWTRVSALDATSSTPAEPSPTEIERSWRMYRQRHGVELAR